MTGLGNGGLQSIAALMKHPKLEIYEDAKEPKNKWRWRITMSSDIVAASTQGYATRQLCIDNLKSIKNLIAQLEQTGKLV
jgi:uncharacterized protein YegP (UPF0339 family)